MSLVRLIGHRIASSYCYPSESPATTRRLLSWTCEVRSEERWARAGARFGRQTADLSRTTDWKRRSESTWSIPKRVKAGCEHPTDITPSGRHRDPTSLIHTHPKSMSQGPTEATRMHSPSANRRHGRPTALGWLSSVKAICTPSMPTAQARHDLRPARFRS